MLKRILLFLAVLSVPLMAQKQGPELIDSLKSRLQDASEDTSKVRILGKLAFQYFRYDTDLGIYYAGEAIKLAEKLKWDLGLAFSYNYMGTNYAVKGNYPKALEFFHKSLAKYTEKRDKQGIAFLCNNLGNLYRLQKEYKKAIGFFDQATQINKGLGSNLDLAKNYNNLGITYSLLPDYRKSDEYYNMGLDISRKENNEELEAQILINIAENHVKMKDYCEALKLTLQAIEISKKLNIDYDRAVYYRHAGQFFLTIAEEKAEPHNGCNCFSADSRMNLLNARKYLHNAIELMEGINDLSELSEISLLLSQVYEKLGETRSAFTFYKKHTAYKDSVFSKDNSIKIAKLEKERETDLRLKQSEIYVLEIEKKNFQFFTSAAVFAALLLLAVFIAYFYFKRRSVNLLVEEITARRQAEEKIRNSLKEKEILLKEVHHRVKNNMQVISSLISIQADMLTDESMKDVFRESQNRIQAMAMVHELTYQTPDFANIDIGVYFINLIGHLKRTYVHKIKQVEFIVDIEKINLNLDKIIPIGLIVNEIISNALKHAFPDKRPGRIMFSIKKDNDSRCIITLADNGTGIPGNINVEEQKTLGLFLIASLCEQIGSKLSVNSSDKGTEYIISFNWRGSDK